MPYQFDPSSHRYRDTETGRFVKVADVTKLIDAEVNRLEVRLKGHARLLAQNKIDIPEFQTRMAQSLKESHLRNAAVGAGGTNQLTPTHYGKVGAQLKKQYKYLHGFGQDLADGKLTPEQAIRRAGSYAKSAKTSFFESEFTSRGKYGFYAKRLLDAQSRHCASCISYQRLAWTLIQNVIPPGVDCECGGRCRCRLVFRKV
ncbi:MAG TPA: hypothetical protein VE944_22515 [Nostoc sp.]|uniref:hypothetical protein n=1 Tax=Nostoc sp. TaxID=1180 RepID=UPI002D61A31D|nr:hypothetical protein [Nostoc sp.]HYX17070.1 hypothetical protein [Nostoc sp.]